MIDTPGFNDTNALRTDKRIINELTKVIRPRLYNKKKGITGFVQCIMPDASNRIRETSISAMNNILFLLNSIDPKTNPKDHPRLIVIFNDVSRHELLYDTKKIIDQELR